MKLIKGKILNFEPYRLSNGESILLNHWVASKPSQTGIFTGQRIYGTKFLQ